MNKPCSKCNNRLSVEWFSKKQLRQRNHKHLLCFRCLGRPLPSSSVPSNGQNNTSKRECYECGKILPRIQFSKTQWGKKSRADCRACVGKKQSTIIKTICQQCRQPNAVSGFSICRECHSMQKQKHRSSSGGVRYLVPDFRKAHEMSFQTTPLDRNSLVGSYDVIYFSVDENWSQEATLSSTARGVLVLDYHTNEGNKKVFRGSINLEHPVFHERVRSICSFQEMEQDVHGSISSHPLGSDSFFLSHVHAFAPDTTWHDPRGDFYTAHSSDHLTATRVPGKLKFLDSSCALYLDVPVKKGKRRPKTFKIIGILEDSYNDVSRYWVCNHFRLPEDVGRLIRKYVSPPPVLHLLPGDVFIVTKTRRKKESDWSEIIVVARKKKCQ